MKSTSHVMNINLNTVLALTIKKIFLPISSDDRQHVSRCIRRGLSDFEGHVPQVHDSKAHVLQHGQLLTWMQERDRRLSGRGVLPLFPWAQHGHRAGHGWEVTGSGVAVIRGGFSEPLHQRIHVSPRPHSATPLVETRTMVPSPLLGKDSVGRETTCTEAQKAELAP